MNDQLVAHWQEALDLTADQADLLREFSRYLDRHSLFLGQMKRQGDDVLAYYTDEADWYRFTLSTMRELLEGMRQGHPVPWDRIASIHRTDPPYG